MAVKRRKHTPDQVVRKLREADRLLAEGKLVLEVQSTSRSPSRTYHRWRKQSGAPKTRANMARLIVRLDGIPANKVRLLLPVEVAARRNRPKADFSRALT